MTLGIADEEEKADTFNHPEIIRKDRRNLMITSLIGLIVGKAHIVPKEINALGVRFEGGAQGALLWALTVIIGYFIIIFALHVFHARAQAERRILAKPLELRLIERPFVFWSLKVLQGMEKLREAKIQELQEETVRIRDEVPTGDEDNDRFLYELEARNTQQVRELQTTARRSIKFLTENRFLYQAQHVVEFYVPIIFGIVAFVSCHMAVTAFTAEEASSLLDIQIPGGF
jgi:hypothetical protein